MHGTRIDDTRLVFPAPCGWLHQAARRAGGTITQGFTVGSGPIDPDETDDEVTVTTAYVVNDADMNVVVTDSPDPVAPDGEITYTVTVRNQGPGTARNPRMTVVGNGGQTRFVSVTAPAGWTCSAPASGTRRRRAIRTQSSVSCDDRCMRRSLMCVSSPVASLVLIAALLVGGCRTTAVSPPRETYVTMSDGVRLFVRASGPARGPLTVFLHGGPGASMTDAGYEMEELLPARRLILYDQRGGGRSDRAGAESLTLERHVEDLEELRRNLGEESIALIGLSWGSALAAHYAAAHPQHVRRIVFLSPMPVAKIPFDRERWESVGAVPPENQQRIEELSKAMTAASGEDLIRLCRERFALGLYARYVVRQESLQRARRCRDDEQIRALGRVPNDTIKRLGDWDFRPLLRTVQTPALVIEGAQTTTTLRSPREWAAALPNGRLLLLEGAGHANWLDQPEAFRRAVAAFLDGGFPANARVITARDLTN